MFTRDSLQICAGLWSATSPLDTTSWGFSGLVIVEIPFWCGSTGTIYNSHSPGAAG
jgi:hypothetical protein